MAASRTSAWVVRGAVAVLPLVAIAAVWYFAHLTSLASAQEVAGKVRTIGERPLGFVYVPAGFTVGCLLFVPVTALIGGVAIAFAPVRGFVYAMSGGLLGGSLRMPLGAFLLGTGLGLLPGVAFFTLLAGRVPDVVRQPTALIISLLAGGVVLVVG